MSAVRGKVSGAAEEGLLVRWCVGSEDCRIDAEIVSFSEWVGWVQAFSTRPLGVLGQYVGAITSPNGAKWSVHIVKLILARY
jgi:hypothetical protein